MNDASSALLKLERVDIFAALADISERLYGACPVETQDRLRKDIEHALSLGYNHLLALLYPSTAAVISENNIYVSGSEEQRQIKRLLGKKLPVILALSFFDDYEYPEGDIYAAGYSRLLDRISAMTNIGRISDERMKKYILSRRTACRQVYKAVTTGEFVDILRKEAEN